MPKPSSPCQALPKHMTWSIAPSSHSTQRKPFLPGPHEVHRTEQTGIVRTDDVAQFDGFSRSLISRPMKLSSQCPRLPEESRGEPFQVVGVMTW